MDGTKKYYRHGELHRDNDFPAIEYSNGTKEWWLYGKKLSLKYTVKCCFCREISECNLQTNNKEKEDCSICCENKHLITLNCHPSHKICKECIVKM